MRDNIYNFLINFNNNLERKYNEKYDEDQLLWDWETFWKKNWFFDNLKKYERFLIKDHNWEVFKENKAWKLVQVTKFNYEEDKIYTFYSIDQIFEWFLKERLFDQNY